MFKSPPVSGDSRVAQASDSKLLCIWEVLIVSFGGAVSGSFVVASGSNSMVWVSAGGYFPGEAGGLDR
jgi:hypothetical protein